MTETPTAANVTGTPRWESARETTAPTGAAPAAPDAVGCNFRDPAFTANRDAPVHRWTPWIAGFSKQFVEDALDRHAPAQSVVLDSFAGVGTALLEADLAGHEAVGFEINPYAAFACRAKLAAHRVDSPRLREAISAFAAFGETAAANGREPQSAPPAGFRTRTPFYSPDVLRKTLLALDFIRTLDCPQTADLFKLAFASTMVQYSNYSYEPSLGRKATAGRPDVDDFPVFEAVAAKLSDMAGDAEWSRNARSRPQRPDGRVFAESFFDGHRSLPPRSVDLIVTSPPYLNNYHYNRNTRPQLYWLGFCETPSDLKRLESMNFGTYWQNARERGVVEVAPSAADPGILEAVAEVRRKNPEKGVYGGNGWANYAAHYFNDCGRFMEGAKWCLRPGGTALVVIGNSILQGVHIPTDRFLAVIAERSGLTAAAIHTPRDARVGSSIVNARVPGSGRLYESVVELRA